MVVGKYGGLLIWPRGEKERAAFFARPFPPNATAMPVNDSLDSRQSHPSSGEFVLVMKTLEGAEKPARMCWVESGTVVPDVIGELPVAMRPAKLDTSRFTLGGKFPCVAQQVLKRNSDQMGSHERFNAFFNQELYPALRFGFLQFHCHGSGDRAH